MTDVQKAHERIVTFEKRYDYDASYLRAILDASPEAFEAFEGFSAMGSFRKNLSPEAYFVAAIAATQTEDCGSCTRLRVRMAREAGVPEKIIAGALGGSLPAGLEQLRRFATGVATNQPTDGLLQSVRAHFGEDGLVEISLCIASARVYPSLKRALGFAGNSCELPSPRNEP